MLKLYNVNKEKIEGLTQCKDLVRERDLKKGEDTLSFSYPKNLSKKIKEECYIETKFNFYVIKEIDNSDRDWINVVAKVNTEGLKSNSFPHFEMVNSYLKDTLNLALVGTGWTIGHNDIVKRRTVRVSNKTSLEVVNEIRKVYRAEIFFDAINRKVNVYKQLGEDKGDFFMENVNLKSLNISSDSYDYVTRLIPLGKDGLTIEEINSGKKYVENYQYSDKIIYATWEDNRYIVVEHLKEDATAKLEELSKPYKSYEADVVDLRGADLGDTITLISKTDEVKEKQRVVKITEYPLEPWKNKVEIANKTYTFEEMQSEVMDTVETADTILTSDGMVDESKIDFNPIRQEFVTIIAQKADITDLNAAKARIGDLEVTKANVTDLKVVNARIDTIYVKDLTAINADITALKVNVGEVEHLLAGNLTAENIAAGAITAGSGIIADGAIGDAQISSLSASKLRAGTIDTSLVTVAGTDGKLNITGNRLQVIHEGFERVALGDVNRDGSVYGLRVRGEDGETILFDERGVTKEGITEGSIDDSKVDDSANIQGHKLDINSVIREINTGDEVIKGTRVQVGDRSLDIELSTQKSLIEDNVAEISNQKTQIQALDNTIKLKVDNQEFNQYKTATENNITTINTQLSKNTSSIDILQEEIALKVSQTNMEKLISDMEIGGRNLLGGTDFKIEPKVWTGTVQIIEGNPNSVLITKGESVNYGFYTDYITNVIEGEKYTLSFECRTTDVTTFNYNYFMIEGENNHSLGNLGLTNIETDGNWHRYTTTFTSPITKNNVGFMLATNSGTQFEVKKLKLERGNKATDWTPAPEDVESEVTAINTKVAGINIKLDSITSRVSSTESKIIKVNDEVSAIESRVSIAERKITDDSIINTVRSSTAYINDLDNKANQEDLNLATSKITTLEQTSENFKISINKYENGKLKGAYYDFTGEAAIFKGAGFVILNDNYTSVLQGDTEGNLHIVGDFVAYQNGERAIHLTKNRINFHNWYDVYDNPVVGSFYGAKRIISEAEPGLAVAHSTVSRFSILYRTNTDTKPYIDFDANNVLNVNREYPIQTYEPTIFFKNVRCNSNLYFGANNRIHGNGDEIIYRASNHKFMTLYNSPLFLYDGVTGKFEFYRGINVTGNLSVSGKKNALHKTKNYGDRLINSYEMAEYYSGDLGSGKLGEDGLCYIYIDDIFDETINTNVNYHIIYGKCGKGDIYTEEKHFNYFVVKGEPGLLFSWELKAKRGGYEYDRLEAMFDVGREDELSIDYLVEDEENRKKEELKEILNNEMNFDLSDYVLGGEKG